jgi:hypothetical protein
VRVMGEGNEMRGGGSQVRHGEQRGLQPRLERARRSAMRGGSEEFEEHEEHNEVR